MQLILSDNKVLGLNDNFITGFYYKPVEGNKKARITIHVYGQEDTTVLIDTDAEGAFSYLTRLYGSNTK